jgi:hypothetical protein
MRADGVVDVVAKRIGRAAVAVEQRRVDAPWQGGGKEKRTGAECLQHQRARLCGGRPVLGQLLVVLDLRRLAAGGDAAVCPICIRQQSAAFGKAPFIQHARNMQQHRVSRAPRARGQLAGIGRVPGACVGARFRAFADQNFSSVTS